MSETAAGIFVLVVILAAVVVMNPAIVQNIQLGLLAQKYLPFDLQFAPGINMADYDGGVIINCLHGGGCPVGVTYINDDTGQVENRTIVPAKAQAVPATPPPDPNGISHVTIHSSFWEKIVKLSYIILIGIISGIVGLILYIWYRSRR